MAVSTIRFTDSHDLSQKIIDALRGLEVTSVSHHGKQVDLGPRAASTAACASWATPGSPTGPDGPRPAR